MAILTTSRNNLAGSTLLEALLAISLLTLTVTGLASALIYANSSNAASEKRLRANLYAREAGEVVRNIRDEDFANLVDGNHGLSLVSNQWQFSGTSDTLDEFTRVVTISTTDANTKQINITVDWPQIFGSGTQQLTYETSITNWKEVSILTTNTPTPSLTPTPGPPPWGSPTVYTSSDLTGTDTGQKIRIEGSLAFISRLSGTQEFTIMDISDPLNPSITGTTDLVSNINGIAISGNYAFLASTNNSRELQIVDFTNTANPSLVAELDIPGGANPFDIEISGNYAFLSYGASTGNELHVIDITDPLNPLLLSNGVELGGNARGSYLHGNYIIISNSNNVRELEIVDISTPTTPTLVGYYDLSGTNDGNAVVANGNYAYIGRRNGEFYTFDITDPSNPILLGSLNLGASIEDLDIDGDLVFAATQNATQEFIVIDVSDPANPVIRGAFDAGGSLFGLKYDLSNDLVFAVGADSTQEFIIYAPQ